MSQVERVEMEKISERSSTGSVPIGEEGKALKMYLVGPMGYAKMDLVIERAT